MKKIIMLISLALFSSLAMANSVARHFGSSFPTPISVGEDNPRFEYRNTNTNTSYGKVFAHVNFNEILSDGVLKPTYINLLVRCNSSTKHEFEFKVPGAFTCYVGNQMVIKYKGNNADIKHSNVRINGTMQIEQLKNS